MSLAAENRKLLVKLTVVAVGMFGFGFALVPFYKAICDVTGLNNLLNADRAPVNTQIDATRSVRFEFDANTRGTVVRFKPLQQSVSIHPGEMVVVEYEVANPSSVPVVGQAIPSYGPKNAAEYVRKLECFCFRQQRLEPGEVRRMPVQFVLDGDLPRDVNTITLSYTYFEVNAAAAAPRAGGAS
ncbi:MAG: cytochrome c oxidase assembly protein [Gammaproteobacteria bacterium]|nr:cytochrome c oxidase assembly protein [Gammaproteobacteria bacterium]